MFIVMYRKVPAVKSLFILLALAIASGGLFMPSQAQFMQAMNMDTTGVSQSVTARGNVDDASTGTCCDATGSVSLACDFLVSQPACVTVYGGSDRVVNSAPVIQSIHIKSVTPPPKA